MVKKGHRCDFLVIGAGIAGASIAYRLSGQGKVLLLEMEEQPGYHSTGRSAALFAESYGNRVIRALTTVSGEFFRNPPAGFADHPLILPRGVLMLAREDQLEKLQIFFHEIQELCPTVKWLEQQETLELVSSLRKDYFASAVLEPESQDIDVDVLHQGFLRGIRNSGGEILTEHKLLKAEKDGNSWKAFLEKTLIHTEILINAAGAWADQVALNCGVAPVSLVPKRRTAMLFEPPHDINCRAWPAVVDVEESFYFKPEGGHLLGSPADETPVEPQDARPQDWDLALAVERIEKALDFPIKSASKTWAGLRSFVADKTPVAGYDPDHPGFFWLAGQGGYGIQTSPALSRVAASLVLKQEFPEEVTALGVNPSDLSPERLRS
ncbi:MAG: FAD-dependent oxidoreductase [Deltaproteobacteria bacterium]|nr:FAD-dependent oxidoreductase [Deltaproteobacteria bacterium]